MSERHFLKLTKSNRRIAAGWVAKAPDGWMLEVREPNRSVEQNAGFYGLLDQVLKQRPVHNGVQMDQALWKAVFMDAWGAEVRFLPKLEGDGMFPAGHRSSHLTVGEMRDLITFILAWCATAGLNIEHFDEKAAA